MSMIFPNPSPRAIAAMVDSLRTAARPASDEPKGLSTGQILAPILHEATALRREPGPPLKGQEAEISDAIAEKFKRQGLKL